MHTQVTGAQMGIYKTVPVASVSGPPQTHRAALPSVQRADVLSAQIPSAANTPNGITQPTMHTIGEPALGMVSGASLTTTAEASPL